MLTPTAIGQVFHGLPDIPISNFTLSFKRNGLVVTIRNLCRPAPFDFQVELRRLERRHEEQHGRRHRSGLHRLT